MSIMFNTCTMCVMHVMFMMESAKIKKIVMKLAKRKYMMSCTGDKPAMHACLHLWNHWSAQRCHDVAGFCVRFRFLYKRCRRYLCSLFVFPPNFSTIFPNLLIEGQYHLDCEGSTGDLWLGLGQWGGDNSRPSGNNKVLNIIFKAAGYDYNPIIIILKSL